MNNDCSRSFINCYTDDNNRVNKIELILNGNPASEKQHIFLDEDQIRAVLSDAECQLVVAGAGCGKTSTLLAKFNYLLTQGYKADEILVLAYNTSAAKTLQIKCPLCLAKTFHAFGYDCSDKKRLYNPKFEIENILNRALYPHFYPDNFIFDVISQEEQKDIENKFKSCLTTYDGTYNPLEKDASARKTKEEVFINYICRYISLFKSQSKFQSLSQIKENILQQYPYQHADVLPFFDLLCAIYDVYCKILDKNNAIDFNDMINNAIIQIEEHPSLVKGFKYILVDEYQDITFRRYEFLSKIKNISNAKLFCVGDDWQSIYGFGGSDVSLFTEFKTYFPNSAPNINILTTHRNSKKLVDIAGQFIMKNAKQTQRLLQVAPNTPQIEDPVRVVTYGKNTSYSNIEEAVFKAIDHIAKNLENNETIYLIGRYNIAHYGFNKLNPYRKANHRKLEYSDENNIITVKDSEYKGTILFSTIHKAKGLEADYVIFLDMNSNFPCTIADDYKIEPLLPRTDHYPHAEERRLFYVALTRCKKAIYLLASADNRSYFFDEIKNKTVDISDDNNISSKICPQCGKNLILKHGKDGAFLACPGYPLCSFIQSINFSQSTHSDFVIETFGNSIILNKENLWKYILKFIENYSISNERLFDSLPKDTLSYGFKATNGGNKDTAYLSFLYGTQNGYFGRYISIYFNARKKDQNLELCYVEHPGFEWDREIVENCCTPVSWKKNSKCQKFYSEEQLTNIEQIKEDLLENLELMFDNWRKQQNQL